MEHLARFCQNLSAVTPLRLNLCMFVGLFAIVIGISCTPGPDFVFERSERAANTPYPDLLPLTAFEGGQPAQNTSQVEADLLARAAALRARAASLQGPIIDAGDRVRR